jgi:hypothetical protein
MRGTLRVAFVGSLDVRELLGGPVDPKRALTSTLATPTEVALLQLPKRGWTNTLNTLRSDGTAEPFHVLLTSATAELEDPSREPREALIELTRFVAERHQAPVVVMNASTLLFRPGTARRLDSETEPLDLRVRRLDLAIMEASKATGLSVLDADRLVAEMDLPFKVTGILGYASEVNEVLRDALSSILGELGYAGRPVMGVRVPFMGPIAEISVGRWLKSEGDVVGSGDALCELRLRGLRVRRQLTNALVLASIKQRPPVVRQVIDRDRTGRRTFDEVRALVAGDGAVLRRVLRSDGERVRPGELIAFLTRDPATPVDELEPEVGPFRVSIRTNDPVVEKGSSARGPGHKLAPRKLVRRQFARIYKHVTPEVVTERGRGWVSLRGKRTVLLRRGAESPIRGIYLRGACDVPSLFTLAPMVVDHLEGSLCIHFSGHGVSGARSDLLLQTHAGVPEEFAEEVNTKLGLARSTFQPTLFEPRFTVKDLPGDPATFPKTVVVLSVLPDLSRTVYRHREAGYLVDPGAAWLNNMNAALQDLSFVRWFSEHFERLGRISVDEFAQNYRRLIPLIRHETQASVLVLNSLEIEPFDPTYDYSDRGIEHATRRRRFNIALNELSGELGFHVVDVDRVLKTQGVDRQVDFSHFPVDRMRGVAEDALRILRELEVV